MSFLQYSPSSMKIEVDVRLAMLILVESVIADIMVISQITLHFPPADRPEGLSLLACMQFQSIVGTNLQVCPMLQG